GCWARSARRPAPRCRRSWRCCRIGKVRRRPAPPPPPRWPASPPARLPPGARPPRGRRRRARATARPAGGGAAPGGLGGPGVALGSAAGEAVPDLAAATRDGRLDVAEAACRALANFPEERSVTALVALVRGPDEARRRAAAGALARLGAPGKESVAALVAALRADLAVGRALERLGPPAVPALAAALGHPAL